MIALSAGPSSGSTPRMVVARNTCGVTFYDFDLDESTPANGDDETYYMLYVP